MMSGFPIYEREMYTMASSQPSDSAEAWSEVVSDNNPLNVVTQIQDQIGQTKDAMIGEQILITGSRQRNSYFKLCVASWSGGTNT